MAVYQPQCESVKVLSPVIFDVTLDQGFHLPEVSTLNISEIKRDVLKFSALHKRERLAYMGVSGSKSVAGK